MHGSQLWRSEAVAIWSRDENLNAFVTDQFGLAVAHMHHSTSTFRSDDLSYQRSSDPVMHHKLAHRELCLRLPALRHSAHGASQNGP